MKLRLDVDLELEGSAENFDREKFLSKLFETDIFTRYGYEFEDADLMVWFRGLTAEIIEEGKETP